MKTITLEVSDSVAERLGKMSASEKKTLSKKLDLLIGENRTLDAIMDDISNQSERNGLTPEIFEQLLKDIETERT